MNDDIHGDEARELHERNQRALAYLDQKEKMQDEIKGGRTMMLGCLAVLFLSAVIWYGILTVVKALFDSFS